MATCKICGASLSTRATYCKATDCTRKRVLGRVHKYRAIAANRLKENLRQSERNKLKGPEVMREYGRGYYQNNKQKLAAIRNKRRAKKRSLPKSFTADQWRNALNYFNGCCAVCGRPLNDLFGTHRAARDHWIPVSYDGDDNPGTVATNMLPLCQGVDGCNNKKRDKMPGVWLREQYPEREAIEIETRINEYFESMEE